MGRPKKIKYEDIHDKDIEELSQETTDTTTEDPADDKPDGNEDKETEEVKETAPDKEDVPQTNAEIEALKKELSEVKDQSAKASVEMVDKFKQVFGVKEDKKDEPTTPWEKEHRQPTWKEALDYVAEQSHERIKKEMEEADNLEKQQAETEQKRQSEYEQNMNTYWDMQLKELEEAGKIPKVTDPKNEKDPGRVARITLFTTMNEVSAERQKKGLPAITSLKEIFYENYKPADTLPDGAYVPVAGKTKAGGSSSDGKRYGYNDIHNSSFEDLLL